MSTQKNLHFHARLFELDSDKPKHVFNFDAERLFTNGQKKLTATYTDLNGTVLSHETVTYKDGKTQSYESVDLQTGEKNFLKVEGKTVKFRFESKKETKSGEEPLTEPLIAGPGILDFIWESRGKLNYGEEVTFRYPVVSRLETFGFTIHRKKVIPAGEDFQYVIEFKPSSLFLRPFVSSQYFTVDFDNEKVIAIQGRCPVMKKEGNVLKEIVTQTVFDTTVEIKN